MLPTRTQGERSRWSAAELRAGLRAILLGPQILAFLPAIILGGYWFGGEGVLFFLALVTPAVFALAGSFSSRRAAVEAPAGLPDLPDRSVGLTCIASALDRAGERPVALLLVGIEGRDVIIDRFGPGGWAETLRQSARLMQKGLRGDDMVFTVGATGLGVLLTPRRRPDLETLVALARRLQESLDPGVRHGALTDYPATTVGFVRSDQIENPDPLGLLTAAELALGEARAAGDGAIRAYAPELEARAEQVADLEGEIAAALDEGQVQAWFQPQVCAASGEITGAEALVRWEHPTRGLIGAADTLAAVRAAGLRARLTALMLYDACRWLRDWDESGVDVPRVSVNLGGPDLRDPDLVERIQLELDRFDLLPGRLCLEVLETAITRPGDEVAAANLERLSALGCPIDLDDFGTGATSITMIRRFSIARLKIDRSFVTRVDADGEQAAMVRAILTMARQLDIETLAEGVETPGEAAALTGMGCGHLQGFAVARPMPPDELGGWVATRRAALARPGGEDDAAGDRSGDDSAAADERPVPRPQGKTA